MNTALPPGTEADIARARLAARFTAIRATSLALAAPLSAEDAQAQSMPDTSPTKWHLAHTTWFFETFVLGPHLPSHTVFDAQFGFLFNSYYESLGARAPRPARGLVTRPSLDRIFAYRADVDAAVTRLLDQAPSSALAILAPLIELGLNHEQQHQELILMDIKHLFSCNPFPPAYATPAPPPTPTQTRPLNWVGFPGGLVEIGHAGPGFAFDNESPRHKTWLEPYRLADRLVTCGDYAAFIADGGYRTPRLWLSEGWATAQTANWTAPLYWQPDGDAWSIFTLRGQRPLSEADPVVHLSYYEADAYARWAGARLPTEAEWEHAAATLPITGNFLETGHLHPTPAPDQPGLQQMFGDVWEFTASPYTAYPGYQPDEGAIGEYNGKFMVNQIVLRGGCCATPADHTRATYRNFFPAAARWMFGGVRLAR